MTVKELIMQLQDLVKHGLNENDIVKAFDGDSGQMEEVTGFLYGGSDHVVEICTDDNS
jgi:hypothetical protein